MRVHHLDCCTMCPRGRSAVNGEGSLLAHARLVSHCLLIETDAHGMSPAWETYEGLGEPWKGVPAVRQLAGLPAEILALPLGGHSRGHAAIAVDTGRGWLVHAGDAYFHRSVIERGDTSRMPWALRGVERFIAFDFTCVRANHALLAKLARHPDVTVFSSHDPVEYERLRAREHAQALFQQTPERLPKMPQAGPQR